MKKVVINGKGNKSGSNEKVEDLSKLPKYNLLEMLERQNKLLSNRSALDKLKDKGNKIKNLKKQIEDELEKRHVNTNLCDVMAGLTLSPSQINALEWTSNTRQLNKERFKEEEKESEENPLKILATHSGTVFSNKILKIEEQSEPLIIREDIEEIYAAKLCDRIDRVEATSRYLPHKTLNRKFDSKKSLTDYKPEDLCSASQPPSKFGGVKHISLEASVKLQYDQAQHLKEVQLKHASDRLKDKTYTIGNLLPSHEKLKAYRNPALVDSESECDEEIQEVEDECAGDEDVEGTVTYRISE